MRQRISATSRREEHLIARARGCAKVPVAGWYAGSGAIYGADPRNHHQAPARLIVPDDGQQAAVQDAGLFAKHPLDNEQRFDKTAQVWSISAMIKSISAITLATHDMSQAVRFYRMLGFEIIHGDEHAEFTSFRAGTSYLNLITQPAEREWSLWGRVIFYESDVDALHARVVAGGYRPDTAPRDAEWGERFFHLADPDGHELSFAQPLR